MKLNQKQILILNTIVFTVVALVHLTRFLLQTPISIGAWELPLWLSGIAVIGAGFLAIENWINIPKKTSKIAATILAGIFVADFSFVLGSWYYGLSWLGFSGNSWLYAALFDGAIIALLVSYIWKNSSY